MSTFYRFQPTHLLSASKQLPPETSPSGSAARVNFKSPNLPTRLALPADYANTKLYSWNQKEGSLRGNPWSQSPGSSSVRGLAATLINSGTSVVFHRTTTYADVGAEILGMSSTCNLVIDKVNHKYSYDFYLDNDLEETSPTVLYDDDETYWSGVSGVTISEETTIVAKGTSSIKAEYTASAQFFNHDYGASPINISSYEFVCIYIYGANSGITTRISLGTGGTTDRYRYDIVDNYTGWRRHVIPINAMTVDGSPSKTNITLVQIGSTGSGSPATLYYDRLLLNVGQWVYVEAYVPDALRSDVKYAHLYSWDGASYQDCYQWNDSGVTGSVYIYYLNGLTQNNIYGGRRTEFYKIGQRGGTVGRSGSSFGGSATLTYSAYYGCLKRIGFALKMPPDDGQDSATAGISQCRLKLEVYYTDSGDPSGVYGQTTYEFSNDNNAYYGLTNWGYGSGGAGAEPWCCLFNSTSKYAALLGFNARPTTLKVCADENEYIRWVEYTCSGKAHMVEAYVPDMTTDTDSDGVPNFLDADIATNISTLASNLPDWT